MIREVNMKELIATGRREGSGTHKKEKLNNVGYNWTEAAKLFGKQWELIITQSILHNGIALMKKIVVFISHSSLVKISDVHVSKIRRNQQ